MTTHDEAPHGGSGSDDPTILPWARQRRIRAVVFDTNAFGPLPDLAQLEHRATDLHRIGIEIWIPEPVAWEWAEHLSTRWTELAAKVRSLHADLSRGRLPVPDPAEWQPPGVEQVVDHFLEGLRSLANVRLIPLSPDNARAAVRDQVLLLPPAKTKGRDVKTGASDSGWLRDVIAAAGSVEHLVFVTTDADVRRACDAWGQPEAITCKVPDLPLMFNDAADDDGAAARAIARHLVATTRDQDGDDIILDIPSLNVSLDSAAAVDMRRPARITTAEIVGITEFAGLSNTKVLRPIGSPPGDGDGTPSGTGRAVTTAHLVTEANAAGPALDAPDEIVQLHRWPVLVTARLEVSLEDGAVKQLYPVGTAAAVVPTSRFETADEALVLLKDALTAVPGLDIPDEWPEGPRAQPLEIEISGTDTSLTLDFDSMFGEWTLEITVDTGINEHRAVLRCQPDPDARTTSGTLIYPEYYIQLDDGDSWRASPDGRPRLG